MTIERAPKNDPQRDPYTPPPRYKNKSGGILRVVILAALLGVAFAGYSFYASQPQSAGLVAEEQELAANTAPVPMTDSALPADATTESAPAPAPAPTAAPRSTAPAPAQQSEPLPPPSTTTIDPSTTPPVQ